MNHGAPQGPYAADLALALDIADAVDALTLAGSHGEIEVEVKPDDTPVTAIDRGAEHLVRQMLTAARPADAIQGEEYGLTGDAARRWVVDPIDGTKNFVRGVPVWATLIGLVDRDAAGRDVAVVGVVSAPALGRRWYAAVGDGAWSVTRLTGTDPSPRRLRVSATADLSQAYLSIASVGGWVEQGREHHITALQSAVGRVRGFGDFWSYMLVAEGAIDLATEPELSLHDMAALAPIVTEAGGTFTSLTGQDGPFGGNALASNGLLHTAALAVIAP